jgi:hypothetical protein
MLFIIMPTYATLKTKKTRVRFAVNKRNVSLLILTTPIYKYYKMSA